MHNTYEQLRALQTADSELATLSTRLDEAPKRISRLTRASEQAKSQLEATRSRITEHRKQYKLAEVELKSAEERINTYSVQLYSAKTNEQYKAFLKEIETQKKLRSTIEDRMIALMEETEALERRRGESEKETARIDGETGQKVAVLESELRELEAAVTERQKLRQELVESIPPNTVKLYERIRKSKAGLAVVTTRNERCDGCLNPIPPQRLIEVDGGKRIYTCEACGRILLPERSK